MSMTIIILLVLALYLLQLFLQETSRFGVDIAGIVGTRDKLPDPTVLSARLERAKNNMMESLPPFLALALLLMITKENLSQGTHGALVFLIARTLYVPAYASGIPLLRSVTWLTATFSLIYMAWLLV